MWYNKKPVYEILEITFRKHKKLNSSVYHLFTPNPRLSKNRKKQREKKERGDSRFPSTHTT